MRLVVFDIDGTLTETMAVDTECFLRAFEEVFGFVKIDPDWSRYRHATDPGILNELIQVRRGRSPSAGEVAQFRNHFLALLEAAAAAARFRPIPGAGDMLRRLSSDPGFQVALATGAWSASARLKLFWACIRCVSGDKGW